MGLDNYASRSPDLHLTPEDIAAFEDANIELCGGILTGAPPAFRGKTYAPLAFQLTGISLYQTWIAPGEVEEIAQALEQCDAERVPRQLQDHGMRRRWSPAEIIELRKFFKVCRERGLGLVGWW